MATSQTADPPGEKLYDKSVIYADTEGGDYGTSLIGSEYHLDCYDPEYEKSMIEDVIAEDSLAEERAKIDDQFDDYPRNDPLLENITARPRPQQNNSATERGYDVPPPKVNDAQPPNAVEQEFDIDRPLPSVKKNRRSKKEDACDITESPTSSTSRDNSSDSLHHRRTQADKVKTTTRTDPSLQLLDEQEESLPLVSTTINSSVDDTGSFSGSDRRQRFGRAKRDPDLELVNEQMESSILLLPIVPAVFASNSTLTVPVSIIDVPQEVQHDQPTLKTSTRNLKKGHEVIDPQFVRIVLERLRRDEGFPLGLGLDFIKSTKAIFPLRLWLIDNNNISSKQKVLMETLQVQIQLAKLLEISSILCMINTVVHENPDDYSLSIMAPGRSEIADQSGVDARKLSQDVQRAVNVLLEKSLHVSAHRIYWPALVEDVKRKIKDVEDQLLWHKQKVLLVLATDNLPVHDKSFCQAFAELQKLPVTIIARVIGTQYDSTSLETYRAAIDEMKLPIRVLGDFEDQQRRVYHFNPWLNYAKPLHVCRETGFEPRVFKLLDVKRLDKDELREFLVRLFGRLAMLTAPDIYTQWSMFFPFMVQLNISNGRHRRTVTGQLEPWIDMEWLDKFYGSRDIESSQIAVTLEANTRVEI